MVPPTPTAQTSFGPLPQTPTSALLVPLGTVVQTLPSQRTIVPAAPTAQTSLGPLPQTPASPLMVPLDTLVQVLPFQRKMVPAPPRAQTSLGPLPQTGLRPLPCGNGFSRHQRSVLQKTHGENASIGGTALPPFPHAETK
jgi:hypothetical protein